MRGEVRLSRGVAVADSAQVSEPARRRLPAARVHAIARSGVSAIVVNYNSGDFIERCIRRLMEAVDIDEIVVVDNASRDGSVESIRGYENGPRPLRILSLCENIGFAAAVNLASSFCSSGWLLLVNPDCLIERDTVSELLAAGEPTSVGAVGGLLLNPDGSEQRGCRRHLPTILNTLGRLLGLPGFLGRDRDLNLTYLPLPSAPCEVEAVSGALMMVRREAVNQLRGLDDGFFLHCEDLDLCQRLRDGGWGIRFAPAAVGVHRQGSCSEHNPVRVLWHKHRGMIRYFRKHGGRRALCVVVSAALHVRFAALAPATLLGRWVRRMRDAV